MSRHARWLALVLAAAPVEEPSWLPVTIKVEGSLLDARFADVDGDGRPDLVLAAHTRRPGLPARRELLVHEGLAAGGFALTPSRSVPVPDDVIVWGCADVRAEPGRELLFMTRTGVWSLSTQVSGLRDNVRRLAVHDLLYQVPSARELPWWPWVLPQRDGGKDRLLLAGGRDLSLWSPRAESAEAGAEAGAGHDGEPALAEPADYVSSGPLGVASGPTLYSVKAPGELRAASGGVRVTIEGGGGRSLFLGEAPAAFAAMLQAEARYEAPALLDVDGDGQLDLVLLTPESLVVRLGDAAGLPSTPTRVEALPAYLRQPDTDLVLKLRDLDGDGDLDLQARVNPEQDSLDHVVFTYFLMINDGRRLLPEQPTQVLRFEGSGTDSQVLDVDGDGRPDLAVTKYELPELKDLVTGFKLRRSVNVFLAAPGPEPFERKAALRDDESFTIDSLQDALVNMQVVPDCSGDGVADLVQVDLTGKLVIRRIRKESRLFGAAQWSIDREAWKRFDLGEDLSNLAFDDVNGDGVPDPLNTGEDSVSIMLSRGGGGGR